jgi:hypothetical protein
LLPKNAVDGVRLRTLRRALGILKGSEIRLATALDVAIADLKTYLAGKQPVPQKVFLIALDIVAGRKP